MSQQNWSTWARRALLPVGLALGLMQVGCAHPVAVEPSVVISSRMGPAPVYAQIGMPPPMVVMPPPRVVYAPPPVFYGPPVYQASPAWGWGRGYRWGHGHHEGHQGHGWR